MTFSGHEREQGKDWACMDNCIDAIQQIFALPPPQPCIREEAVAALLTQ